MDWTPIIVAIASAVLGGGVTAFFTARSTAANQLSDAAGKLAKSFSERLSALDAEVEELCRRVRHLETVNRRLRVLVHYLLDGIHELMQQISAKGDIPVWCPPADERIERILSGDADEVQGDEPAEGQR